jgi:hypothetical protein
VVKKDSISRQINFRWKSEGNLNISVMRCCASYPFVTSQLWIYLSLCTLQKIKLDLIFLLCQLTWCCLSVQEAIGALEVHRPSCLGTGVLLLTGSCCAPAFCITCPL